MIAALFSQSTFAGPILWVGDSGGRLGTVDVATGHATVIGVMAEVMTDIAFDPSGNLYGITFDSLYSIDSSTGSSTLIGSLGASLNSLVFGADGTLYAANTSLFTINTSTGAATLVGTGGDPYGSSGDLAFIDGELYLSSGDLGSDNLVKLDTTTGAGTLVGSIGAPIVFGLATDNNIDLYGLTGTEVLSIDPLTGAGNFLVDYSGQGLGVAYGSAFYSESGAVPEPGTCVLLLTGLAALVAKRRAQSRRVESTG